ncbi:MAG: hypothetical protein ABSD30_10675 [Candidatus Binatus sp.]|jgi:hypothetical protein
MPTVVAAGWAILIVFLVASIIVFRVRWKFALLLFFVGPLLGMLVYFLISLFALQLAGELGVVHSRDLLSFAFMVYALLFPLALCPNGAFIAVLVLIANVWLEGLFKLALLPAGRRLAIGMIVGGAVGALFAALIVVLVLLAQQNSELVEFVSGGVFDRLDFSTELLISACTGAVDGTLIVILGANCFRPRHLDEVVEGATT